MARQPKEPKGPFKSIHQVAELIGQSERSVRRLIAAKKLRAHRIGGVVRIHDDDLVDFLRSCRL